MRPSRSLNSDVEGATAVEFSIIAMLLFTLLYGILQFGFNYSRYQGLQASAREGARIASLAGSLDEPTVRQRVVDNVPPFVTDPAADLLIDVHAAGAAFAPGSTGDAWCASVGDEVTVRIELSTQGADRYQVNLPMFNRAFPMDVEATYRCENSR